MSMARVAQSLLETAMRLDWPNWLLGKRVGINQSALSGVLSGKHYKNVAAASFEAPVSKAKPADATMTRAEYTTITIGNRLLKHLPGLMDGEAAFLALVCGEKKKTPTA